MFEFHDFIHHIDEKGRRIDEKKNFIEGQP